MIQLLGLGQGSAESAATTPGLRVPGSVCCPVHLLHDIQETLAMHMLLGRTSYWGFIGIMEKRMEATIVDWGSIGIMGEQ